MPSRNSHNPRRMDETEQKVFIERLRLLIGDRKQDEIANGVGLSRQSISNYLNGVSVPSINDAMKMAKYFDVSLDWFVGATDVKSLETDLQAVCKYTGLSENAVNVIRALPPDQRTMVNELLVSSAEIKTEMFFDLCMARGFVMRYGIPSGQDEPGDHYEPDGKLVLSIPGTIDFYERRAVDFARDLFKYIVHKQPGNGSAQTEKTPCSE